MTFNYETDGVSETYVTTLQINIVAAAPNPVYTVDRKLTRMADR
jgi:hypothetical protein